MNGDSTPIDGRRVKEIRPHDTDFLEVEVNRPGKENIVHDRVTRAWYDIDRAVVHFEDDEEGTPIDLSDGNTIDVRDGENDE